jgi:homogentisate 1,2-dioxygenase
MSMDRRVMTPQREGDVARQAHVAPPTGSFERELGRDGFAGPATQMYHRNPPTAWTDIQGPMRPRAFNPFSMPAASPSPWDALDMLRNRHVRIRFWHANGSMDHLVRNSDGDELLFLHDGAASLFCDYGHLAIEAGDYMLLPRGTMWRIETIGPTEFLLIESTGAPYRLPDRGMLGRVTPFDAGILDRPTLDAKFKAQTRGPWQVRVKRRQEIGVISYPYNPLDALGWQGDLYPVRLNVRDIRSVMSDRLHVPPSLLSTFASDRFVVCTATPRPLETDPEAMKLPWYHNNDDYDELIFYHRGKFLTRSSANWIGAMTLHPSGVTHGPSPETLPNMFKHPTGRIDNYAVLIDVIDALEEGQHAAQCEIDGYAMSWRGSIQLAPDASPVAPANAAE